MAESEFYKVLMVHSENGWRGGEAQIVLLMRGLCELGHSVVLAAGPDSELSRRCANLPVEFVPLGIVGGMDVSAAIRLRSITSEVRPDIIHAHSSHAHSCMYLATLVKGTAARRIVSRRVAFGSAASPFSRLKYRRGVDMYIAISRAVGDTLAGTGVPENRVCVVNDGIDLHDVTGSKADAGLRAEFGIDANAPLVGTVAALTREKGHTHLLDAVAELCAIDGSLMFLLVGDGPRRKALEEKARALGIEQNIIFAGFRPDAQRLLSVLDCFVLPSLSEGLGTSIMDAHALGVPVVASSTGGIPEIVSDGVTGLLVAPGHAEGLAAAIRRVLKDLELKASLVAAGKEQSKGYDYHKMVYKTIEAYAASRSIPSAPRA